MFRPPAPRNEWQDCAHPKESCQDGGMTPVHRSRAARRGSRRHLVAALVGPRVAAFELGVVHEVFGLDRSEYVDPWYEFRVVAVEPGPVPVTDGDWTIQTPWGIDDLDEVDTLVVPVWPHLAEPADPVLLDKLRRVHARGGRIVSVCSGAFLLAQAGLLDGRRATTHWMYAEQLADTFPRIQVDPNVLFVDAGDRIYTSAGTAAGIDLCLHLVRLDHGAEVANALARRMVVPPQRSGGQAQFVDTPLPDVPHDDPIGRTLDWAVAHLDEQLTVEDMARQAMVSPRSFARRFRAATGTTPMQWLVRQRVLHAQRLLESTDLPVEIVAQRSGFGTATGLRTHFRRVAGTSPLAYRRTFRPADAESAGRASAGVSGARAGRRFATVTRRGTVTPPLPTSTGANPNAAPVSAAPAAPAGGGNGNGGHRQAGEGNGAGARRGRSVAESAAS
jgi:AraC family transcriptional activator FtrA